MYSIFVALNAYNRKNGGMAGWLFSPGEDDTVATFSLSKKKKVPPPDIQTLLYVFNNVISYKVIIIRYNIYVLTELVSYGVFPRSSLFLSSIKLVKRKTRVSKLYTQEQFHFLPLVPRLDYAKRMVNIGNSIVVAVVDFFSLPYLFPSNFLLNYRNKPVPSLLSLPLLLAVLIADSLEEISIDRDWTLFRDIRKTEEGNSRRDEMNSREAASSRSRRWISSNPLPGPRYFPRKISIHSMESPRGNCKTGSDNSVGVEREDWKDGVGRVPANLGGVAQENGQLRSFLVRDTPRVSFAYDSTRFYAWINGSTRETTLLLPFFPSLFLPISLVLLGLLLSFPPLRSFFLRRSSVDRFLHSLRSIHSNAK